VTVERRKELRKTERFHQIPIFSNLAGQEVGRILRITDEVNIPAGTAIFSPQDPCDGFYIILDGRVDIRMPPGPKNPTNAPTTIATLANRSVFGEMSFLGKRPRSNYAVALEDTRLNKVRGPDFQALLDQSDVAAYKVVYNFAKLIAGRLRRVEDELLRTLDAIGPEKREAKLAELQEFRQTLFRDWSF
jgi:CRP/FNR family transcriptional regulator, dissimilatory nitrate respiration regulator